jgi:hypothetical protein
MTYTARPTERRIRDFALDFFSLAGKRAIVMARTR